MRDLLLDAGILIDHLHRKPGAVAFMDSIAPVTRLSVHAVGGVEILVGARDTADLRALVRYLRQFRAVNPTAPDWQQCQAMIRAFHLSHRVGWPDCLIAATCLRLGLPIATVNDRDFRIFRGLKVVRPY